MRDRPLAGLRHRTEEGIELETVYFPTDVEQADREQPGFGSYRRGPLVVPVSEGWDLRARIEFGDPEAVNRFAREELEGGANSLELALETLEIESAMQLNLALEEIYLDLSPISLDAGADFGRGVEWLCEVWNRREHDPTLVEGAWNIDPITLALSGRLSENHNLALGRSLEEALQQAGVMAQLAVSDWPKVTAMRVSTAPFHEAGCNDAQELAAAMATGVLYLRTMEAAGIEPGLAFESTVVGLSMDADLFAGVAKLRAARVLWSRLAEICGVGLRRGLRIHATTSRRMMAHRETMTNALRVTTAASAAVLGGADVVTTLPYDTAIATREGRAARLARNTQVILRQESHFDHVLDPAGGSWYLESRTNELARAAWAEFQAIEGAGGIVEDLRGGRFLGEIRSVSQARTTAIAERKRPLVGVSEFARFEESIEDSEDQGRRFPILFPVKGSLLPMVALDAEFERFRRTSDRYLESRGARPWVWLANLGPLAQHNARTTFCRNLLAAGGVEALDGEGLDRPDAAGAAMARALIEAGLTATAEPDSRGAAIAILCSSDQLYQEWAAPAVESLKASKVGSVFYAGDPRERREDLEQAGVDGFLYVGLDVIALFEDLYSRLGISPDAVSEDRVETPAESAQS